jgi:hypothetical protein
MTWKFDLRLGKGFYGKVLNDELLKGILSHQIGKGRAWIFFLL